MNKTVYNIRYGCEKCGKNCEICKLPQSEEWKTSITPRVVSVCCGVDYGHGF